MSINQFRRNPVTGQWTIIIEEYNLEELLGTKQTRRKPRRRKNGDQCPFCSGHESETPTEIFAVRNDNSAKNTPGWSVRVIPNKQPVLQIFGDLNNRGVGIYDVLDGIGAHELVVEAPQHNLQIPDMELPQIQNVLAAYRERLLDLKRDTRFRYVLLHKNYGEGEASVLQHSHSHIIATPITPTRIKHELINAMEHYRYKERCLFCDVIYQELTEDERVVAVNDKFLAIAPFAARSPFEIWLLPKQHEPFFESNNEHPLLAAILKEVLRKVNVNLNNPNYLMVLHSGPNTATGKPRGYWKTVEKDYHWHIEITPRFRGFASFDIGSGFPINVVSPERATEMLKNGKI
jgi:UDPglucose--hexose-1-phosphate uridylyltransferase